MTFIPSHDCHPESRPATPSRRLRAAARIEGQPPSVERTRTAFAPVGSRGKETAKVDHALRRTLGLDRGTKYQMRMRYFAPERSAISREAASLNGDVSAMPATSLPIAAPRSARRIHRLMVRRFLASPVNEAMKAAILIIAVLV